jgi:hypothetical protein
MTYKGSRITSKKSRESRQHNRTNHTHFKQFNKRLPTSTKHNSVVDEMRADTTPAQYMIWHRNKKDLLVGVIKTSATVREAWSKIKDDPALRIIVQGMNGNESVDPQHYIGNLLQQCVRDGMLVCVYERQLNANSANQSINHRWRYMRKSNLPMITYYIIRDYRHSICEKCIKTIKKIVKTGSAFINR